MKPLRSTRARAVPDPDLSEELKAAVWEKAQAIPGWDPDCRLDEQGNPIFRPLYGDAVSGLGWEIGYIVDPADGGAEDLSNLCVRRVER
jgi:hypothetical protein